MTPAGPVFLPCAPASIGGKAPSIAIALFRHAFNERVVSHAGILFRQTNHVLLLDLYFDGSVHTRDIATFKTQRFSWVIPAFPPPVLAAMTWFCQATAERSENLGYWLEFCAGTTLVDDGTTISLSKGSVGLTCSTFVLALFASQGKNLLDLDDWVNADDARKAEDAEHQKWLLSEMETPPYKLSEELKKRVGAIPCLRYSPEDIIGSCRSRKHPAKYADCDKFGREVRHWLDEVLPFTS